MLKNGYVIILLVIDTEIKKRYKQPKEKKKTRIKSNIKIFKV